MGEMQAFSQDPKRERPILVRYIFSKGGGGWENVPLETFEVYVTSYQYLFQARSTFFKHTEFVPLYFFT
jgi:hypothetical protein